MVSPIDQCFDLTYINEDTDEQEVHVYDHEELRYYFIAGVAGWEYYCHGADWIMMCYQSETKSFIYF